MKQDLLLVDGIGDLMGLASEVKVFADGRTTTKGFVVEIITSFIELVAEAIVRIIKVERLVVLKSASTQAGKSIGSLPKAGSVGSVATVPGKGGIKPEE